MNNRYEPIGNFKFVGTGEVLDNKTGKVFKAQFRVNSNKITIQNRKTFTLGLTPDENETTWDLTVFDGGEE